MDVCVSRLTRAFRERAEPRLSSAWVAAAMPYQEIKNLALGVLGSRPLESDCERHVVAAAVVRKPPQQRAVEHDLIHKPVKIDSGLFAHRPLRYIASRRSLCASAQSCSAASRRSAAMAGLLSQLDLSARVMALAMRSRSTGGRRSGVIGAPYALPRAAAGRRPGRAAAPPRG